jgi:hypothetical protein
MSTRKNITDRDRLKVMLRVRELINNGWVAGSWKTKRNGKNGFTYHYCIEGACAEAALEILPQELLDLHGIKPTLDISSNGSRATKMLSVEETSKKLYGVPAQTVNDRKSLGEKAIKKIVKRKIDALRKKVK